MTLKKMCKESHHIRLLKVDKSSPEKGVIVYEAAESFKGRQSQIASFKHVVRTDDKGFKPILDWMANGKSAMIFYIEGNQLARPPALGYVFIDGYCYSVDYSNKDQYWLAIRGEPHMSACFHGSVEKLKESIKAILAGKDVDVAVHQI
jgi:hypothetical protein